ncbi:MAG: hypothetical protein M1819_005600 [Sarea resinae]|nr:MAG: hypothetical protein M1819_005600 [Sarea resinae]
MADPLSLLGTLIAVCQVTPVIVQYLRDIKHVSSESKKLLLEIKSASGVIRILRDIEEEAGPEDRWAAPVQTLKGSVEEYQLLLKRVESKLALTARGPKKIGKAVVWPFQKKEIGEILGAMERYKTTFLSSLQHVQIELSKDITENMMSIKQDSHQTRKAVATLIDNNNDRVFKDLMFWLSPLNFQIKQRDIYSKHHEGTDRWIFQETLFQEWEKGSERVLWCPGILGAGKTVMASVIVNYLTTKYQSDKVGIACIYCNHKERDEQTAENLIASVSKQLIERQPALFHLVSKLHESYRDLRAPATLVDLTRLLQAVLSNFPTIYILVDAPDECSGEARDILMTTLRRVSMPSTRILITSRPNNHAIAAGFPDAPRLEIEANLFDIEDYIGSRIVQESRLAAYVKVDRFLHKNIVDSVKTRSQAMFLLARLHMDALARCKSLSALKACLRGLSQELDDVYEEAMGRIRNQNKEDAKLGEMVLSWIAYATRPLSIRELQHALATDSDEAGDDFDEEALLGQDDIVSSCVGLVSVDPESTLVRLMHYSTQEYFERNRQTHFPDAQEYITTTCLKYLSFRRFSDPCHNFRDFDSRLCHNPFLSYAAQNWGHHARGRPENTLLNPIVSFLGKDSNLSCACQVAEDFNRMHDWDQYSSVRSGLIVAASFGLGVVISALLDQDWDINTHQKNGGTALYVAAELGHHAIVRLLLDRGASARLLDRWAASPLHAATRANHPSIVQMLLRHDGQLLELQDRTGRTALQVAVLRGHVDIVKLLIGSQLSSMNIRDSNQSLLHSIAERSYLADAELPSDSGANVMLQDMYGNTPLHTAAQRDDVSIMRLLLLANEELLSVRNKRGRTALHRASQYGCAEAAKLLLESQPSLVNIQDNDGKSAIHHAAEGGHVEVVQLLMDSGADLMLRDGHGSTSLHAAAYSNKPSVINLLLEHKAELLRDLRNSNGKTALHIASEGRHRYAAKLLIDHGAAVSLVDSCDKSPLDFARSVGSKTITSLLLAAGAE